MKLIEPPWRNRFEQLICSANKEIRFAAPYYNTATLAEILRLSKKGACKRFLLSLSEGGIKSGVQSATGIKQLRSNPSCRVRFIKNLHAKFMIADCHQMILTSSNLTSAGLDRNIELGIQSKDPKLIRELCLYFDSVWDKATEISQEELQPYLKIHPVQRGTGGKHFGTTIRLNRSAKELSVPSENKIGWILVHSNKEYGQGKKYESPQDELRDQDSYPIKWNWNRGRPLKIGGPYQLLLAFNGRVFAKARGSVIHQNIDRYNFAFSLTHVAFLRRPVDFDQLPLGKRRRSHRDLISLDDKIFSRFRKLSGR